MTGARLIDPAALERALAGWRASGLRVALLLGDFDVLAVGHARVIAAARASADRVVIAVREDHEVTARRGERRPVLASTERARLVAALRGVDRVVVAGGRSLEALGFRADEVVDAERELADPVERVRARGDQR